MRIFGRRRDRRATALRRTEAEARATVLTPVLTPVEAVRTTDVTEPTPSAVTAVTAMSRVAVSGEVPVGSLTHAPPPQDLAAALEPGESDDAYDDSDVFVCRRVLASGEVSVQSAAAAEAEGTDADAEARAVAQAVSQAVTLYVYGWENVQPGPLSWAFPSLRSALDAVRTMRNAVAWCIVAGIEWTSMDDARDEGAVLIEQSA